MEIFLGFIIFVIVVNFIRKLLDPIAYEKEEVEHQEKWNKIIKKYKEFETQEKERKIVENLRKQEEIKEYKKKYPSSFID